MTPRVAGGSGVVRVTVASGTRRVDLALPAAVPVVELLPELARTVGLLDRATVHAGYRLLTTGGRVLSSSSGLAGQGVEDGCVLTVAGLADEPAPSRHDDLPEAVAEAVERDFAPWRPVDRRRATLVAAGVMLGLGPIALLAAGETATGGALAFLLAGALLAAAVVLGRRVGVGPGALAGLSAAPYAAVAGLLLAPGRLPAWSWPLSPDLFAGPLLGAGTGLLVVGAVLGVGLPERRASALPAGVVGAVWVAVAIAVRATGADAGVLLIVATTALVLAGSLLPALAFGVTGAGVESGSHRSTHAAMGPLDPDRVAADTRAAHEILVALTAAVGALVTLMAPLAVARGPFGVPLAIGWCLVGLLRTRQHRVGHQVVGGVVATILGLASTAVAVLALHPHWRPETAVVLATAGGALLAGAVLPRSPSVRRERLLDLVEATAVLSLMPLTVLSAGALALLGR